jgi:hypothetical protein
MPSAPDDFFVGYGRVSKRVRKLLQAISASIAIAVVLMAITLAGAQRNPGEGVWEPQERTLEGTYLADPTPTLLTDEGPVLLVGEGKRASPLVGGLDSGQRIAATGTMLRRGELQVLETYFLDRLAAVRQPLAEITDVGPVELVGEIIDPKCFSAAMKPGDGKAHKACATLCIRGGVPPMFAVRNTDDPVELYLLTNAQGQALGAGELEAIVPYIADAVSVQGRQLQRGDERLLCIERIRRLTP